jgi:hypothetical protein
MYAARSIVTIAQQMASVKGERARKRQQFATVLHTLQEGRPMLEYQALRPLFTFLGVPHMSRNHWSDSSSWELAECLHSASAIKDPGSHERSSILFGYL